MPQIRRLLFFAVPILLTARICSAANITLAWDRNTEPNIGGYVVAYGTQPGSHPNTFDVGNTATYQVSNLTAGQKYFFVVSAYNTSRVMSAPSAEVSGIAPAP